MINGVYDNKTTEAVWVRTEILNSLNEPSTPPTLYGGRKRRLIPSGCQGKSQNERANNHKQTDWGWVLGHVIASTQSTKSSSPHRHSEKTTIHISDSSSPFHGKTFEVHSKQAFVMANAHDCDDSKVTNDLVHLTHLHEPAIISSLKKRYARDEIYTATGPILLALNPFKKCPHLYSQLIMDLYSQDINATTYNKNSKKKIVENEDEVLEDSSTEPNIDEEKIKNTPHVFATAHRAFQIMSNYSKNLQQEQHTNQSILVSGESGAGKTMTTKFVMQYLAYLSQLSHNKANIGSLDENAHSTPKKRNSKSFGSKKNKNEAIYGTEEEIGIEQQVLQSNPILESFGNARTIRNDNSSRFGKFIEIQFQNSSKSTYSSTPTLAGASIKTYLLEKVRLITQGRGERNYHIFYEILEGANEKERELFFLFDLTPEDFNMTNSSGTFDRRDGVADTSTYKDLKAAMNTMGFSKEDQFNILSLVCSLLHASNITFVEKKDKSSEASQMEPSNPFVGAAVTLLGVSAKSLNKALCTCAIEAGGEKLMKFLTLQQASKALEAFIKATYSALFEYIVHAINHSIASKNNDTYHNEDLDESMFIGVLDIFGFESFAVNSFEQLCINYCNESLQQQFNKFIFKLEQEEYEREGINWSFIEFPDNQNVLDLIDKKHTGILSILDEQCKLARCTDQSFAKSLHDKCSTHDCYHSTATQRVSGLFSVNHYAGPVEYTTFSFLEKNKDELPKEATELLQSSSNLFISELAEFLNRPQNIQRSSYVSSDSSVCSNNSANSYIKNNKKHSSSLSRASVGSQFGSQLRDLLKTINHTTPHYIRCLKPNDDLVPDNFDCNIIADQLRCAGVLEAVRVSRVGYPQRYTYASFIQRYRILSLKALKRIPKFQRIKSCEVLVKAVSIQIRRDFSNTKTIKDMKYGTGNKDGKSSSDLIEVGIQIGKTKVFLRQNAFDSLERLRTHKLEISCITMQAAVRMFISTIKFKIKIRSIIIIQCCLRGYTAQKYVKNKRFTKSAIKIQNFWRKLQCERNIRDKYFVARWSQRYYRGIVDREFCKRLNMQRKALTIQTFWRKISVLATFKKLYRSILTIQCFYRQRRAYFVLSSLRKDAKDLKKVIQERDLLRLEVKELKLKLEEIKLKYKVDFREKRGFESFQEKKDNVSECHVDDPFIQNSSPKDHASFDSMALKEEVQRLKNELESSRAAKLVYRDFPSNPTDQETALIRFSQSCLDQDREIRALKEENKALRASLKNCESNDESNTRGLNNYLKASNEYVDASLPKESEQYSIKKMFRRKRGRAIPINSYNDDGDDNSTVSSMFTPQKILSQLGPLNAFLGRPNAEETRSSPLSRHFDASYREQKSTAVESRSTISKGLDEIDTFSSHNELCSDGNDRQSTCPSVLSSSFTDIDGKGTLLHRSIKDLDHVGLGQALDDSDDVQRDINTGDNEGRTPLHLAALHSSSEMVSILLDNFAVTNCQDHHGNTPLHYATDTKTIEMLLNNGARPNIPNENGLCALHLAVQRGDLFAVKTLVNNGADVDAADNIKWYTPLHLITQFKLEFKSQDKNQENHHDTSVACQIAEYICSVRPTPDTNFQDKDGNTPLHHCAALEQYDAYFFSKLLLKNGCNPNISNLRGQTPLHLLCHNVALRRFEFYQDFFRLLLSSGAECNVSSQSGCTPLHLSLFHRDIDSAIQLVNHGAQLHSLWTKPSHWEPYWDNEELTEILALDMITDKKLLYKVLSSVQHPQQWAPPRLSCMQCKAKFGPFLRQHHCRKCGRIVCGQCSPKSIDPAFFPTSFKTPEFIANGPCRVCIVCQEIIHSKLEESRNST